MLGVVRMSLYDFGEARSLIERAGAISDWKYPTYRHNYGYLLSAYLSARGAARRNDDADVIHALSAIRAEAAGRNAARGRPSRIAVLRGATNDPTSILPLRSTAANERIVILPWNGIDGPSFADAVQAVSADFDYITFSTHGTPLDEERIVRIAEALDDRGAGWGLSDVILAPDTLRQVQRQWQQPLLYLLHGLPHARLSKNLSAMCLATPGLPVTIDNIVVRRDLIVSIAPSLEPSLVSSALLPELVLQLSRRDEPVFVSDAALRPTLEHAVALGTAWAQTESAIATAFRRYVAESLGGVVFQNPLAPTLHANGLQFIKRALRFGAGAHLDVATLHDVAIRIGDIASAASNTESMRRDGFDLIGFARTESGLGEGLRAIARACEAAGIPVTVSDIDLDVGMRRDDRSVDHLMASKLLFRQQIIVANPDALAEAIHHEGVGSFSSAHKVGCWFWELEKPPAAWVRASRLLNELWVASDFVRRAFADAIAIPVYTVPPPVTVPKASRPYARAEFGLRDDDIVFLFSFAYGSFAARKNPWALVRAFREAFPTSVDNARLVIKTVQSELFAAEAMSLKVLAGDDPRITFIDRFMSRDEVIGLQSCCDVYVSLHRSEGFGLGLAECMAQGKVAIGTAYSANLDFMNERNSLLVDYTLIPVKDGEYPDGKGQAWADASIESAARNMRLAYSDYRLRATLGAAASGFMREHYSERAIGELLQRQLVRIQEMN